MSHQLFVYDDDRDFVDHMPAFVAKGVDAGEAVVTVLAAEGRELMSAALGPAADRVTFIECENHYSRPEAALADYDAAVRGYLRDGAPAVRLCGELPQCKTDEQWKSWVGYDAILNRAFADLPVSIMCVYDERRVPPEVVEGARRTHPELIANGVHPNPHYEDPAAVVRDLMRPVPTPLPPLTGLPADCDSRSFRERLKHELADAGVPDKDSHGLLIAADEVLANAHHHGGGPSVLRMGRVGKRFVCEISDRGNGHDDPLAGYLPPRPQDTRGGGLWVARQLTRQLDLFPAEGGGLTARLWV